MNTDSPEDSQVRTPLRVVLTALTEGSVPIYFYESKADFTALWKIVQFPQESEEVQSRKAMIVVSASDYIGEDALSKSSLAAWVSVDAWLLAFAHAYRKPGAVPIVYLLDLRTGKLSLRDDLGKAKLDDWVRRFKPAASSHGQLEFLDRFCEQIQADKVTASISTEMPRGIELFDLIRTHIDIAPLDRHDQSNEIGALILRSGLPSSHSWVNPADGHEFEYAAQILIETLMRESVPHPEKATRQSIIDALLDENKLNSHLLRETSFNQATTAPKILLVDDRHNFGYSQVLQEALGRTVIAYRGIFDSEAADGIGQDSPVKILGNTLSELANNDDLHTFPADILFLDLRLWLDREKEQERTALRKYWDIYCSLTSKAYEESELIKRCDPDKPSHRCLAILPLLVSRLDPALPIVLFSSTQHRSVVQAVRDMPNIITDFAKPYIGGYDRHEYDPTIIMESLRLAIERAAMMVEIRQVWKAACSQWKAKCLTKLDWGSNAGWDTVTPSPSPLTWLRRTWLPLAQRGEYALAAAAPWLYLQRILGSVRIAILAGPDVATREEQDCLAIIRKGQHVPLLDGVSAPESREMAVVAGLALVRLIDLWSKPL